MLSLEPYCGRRKGLFDRFLHATKDGGGKCRHDDGGYAGEQESFHASSPQEIGSP